VAAVQKPVEATEPGVPAGESMARNKMKHFFRMDGDQSAAVFAPVRMGSGAGGMGKERV